MSETAVEHLLDVTRRLEQVVGRDPLTDHSELLEASHRARATVLRQRERQRALHAKALGAWSKGTGTGEDHYALGVVDTLDWVLGNPVTDGGFNHWLDNIS